MTATDTPTDTGQQPAADPPAPPEDGAAEQDGADPNGQPPESPNGEAAKFRRQLRDAETERDGLRTQLDTIRRGEVERLAAATVARPGAIWKAGVELADVLDDNGRVDPAKVTEAVRAAAEQLGLARPVPQSRRPAFNPGQGNVTPDIPPAGWDEFLKRK